MKAPSLSSLAAALFLTRAPFLWTGHVQEDAYLAFRTGFNLADHGQLTFNLGEHYAASTSLFYGYFIASVRWLSGAHALPVILVANAVVVSLAVLRLGRVFELTGWRAACFVGALGWSSGALLPAFDGLETAWCLLYVALLTEHVGPSGITPGRFAALLALGPLLRPDAVFFSASAWAVRAQAGAPLDRRRTRLGAVGLLLGLVVYFALNLLHSHAWLTPSMVAKRAAYPADLSLPALARRSFAVYFEGPLSLLPSSKYVPHALSMLASGVALGALALCLARARRQLPAEQVSRFLFLVSVAALFPLFFAVAGAAFPWYFHPAAFALAACLLIGAFRGLLGGSPRLLAGLATGASLLGCAFQFLLSLNVGRQESGYRASVGKYLGQVADDGDTLVLEPAGIIPYFSGLTTYDEVGLASPRVLPYLGSPGYWLAEFLRDVCPTFTVQRSPFPAPASAAGWTPAEAWFDASYQVIRRFEYHPGEWAQGDFTRALLERGSHADYFVYRRREGVGCGSRLN